MAHVQHLVPQSQLNLGGQFEQTQEVGNRCTVLADALAQAFLGQVVLVYEFAEGECDFNRVQVFSLDVLDQRHLGEFAVIDRADIGGNGVKASQLGSPETAFARYYLIGVGADYPDGEGLDDAQFAN